PQSLRLAIGGARPHPRGARRLPAGRVLRQWRDRQRPGLWLYRRADGLRLSPAVPELLLLQQRVCSTPSPTLPRQGGGGDSLSSQRISPSPLAGEGWGGGCRYARPNVTRDWGIP